MSESLVESQPPQDYPRSMETRVAILEKMAERSEKDFDELKAMVRGVITSVADLRVDVQSIRTEIQSVRTDVERGLRDNLSKTVAWFGLMISLAVAVITIVVKLPHL